jgi:hypothetical protein
VRVGDKSNPESCGSIDSVRQADFNLLEHGTVRRDMPCTMAYGGSRHSANGRDNRRASTVWRGAQWASA